MQLQGWIIKAVECEFVVGGGGAPGGGALYTGAEAEPSGSPLCRDAWAVDDPGSGGPGVWGPGWPPVRILVVPGKVAKVVVLVKLWLLHEVAELE